MFAPQASVCFRSTGSPVETLLPESRSSSSFEESEERFLFCRTCGLPVARERDRLEVGGKHAHALFNPSGILFEVGCFAVAAGCRYEGDLTFEFTWFPGYAWRFAMCRRCASHLGWEYRGAAGGFVGLILTELSGS